MKNNNLKQKIMKKNMGKVDKMLRLIVAMIIGVLYFNNSIHGVLGTILIVLAIVFVITSFVRFCPLYLPFGMNTCDNKAEK